MRTPVLLGELVLACGALPWGCSASNPAQPRAPASSPTPSWCAAIETSLSSEAGTRGFECLPVPNFLVTGFFGPRENPERSDFKNACFAGDGSAAERLGLDVRPAPNLGFSLVTSETVQANGSLDLGVIGPWAPKLAASSAASERVELHVTLQDAEMRVLPSVAEVLGQAYRAAEQEPLREALESCIEALCAADSELYYTAKVLAAVPVVELRFASGAKATSGVELLGAAGFEIATARARRGEVVLRADEKLNVAARLEPARAALERAGTCEQVRSTRARRDLRAALRELGLRVLAGRELDGARRGASKLRRQLMDAKAAFSDHEHGDLLTVLEALDAASLHLSQTKPSKHACDTLLLLARVLTGNGPDNRLHDTLMEVAQPLHRRMIDLANEHSLPCADPIWYRDSDGDGYGDKSGAVRSAKPPAGHVANSLDCFDRNREARPGQKKHFVDHRGDGSFDYDCDGRATPQHELQASGCKKLTRFGIPIRCWAEPGWLARTPGCGKTARWLADCQMSAAVFCDDAKEELRQQPCR
jgi:hypothetical protein